MTEQQKAVFDGVFAAIKTAGMIEQSKEFFEGVMAELAYAHGKHPGWPSADAVHACAILNEEAGKLTRACIDYTYSNQTPDAATDMRRYALRVAAMALRFSASLPTYTPLKQ